MKFSTTLAFATAAAAYNTTIIDTITTCHENGPCYTSTIIGRNTTRNGTISTYVGGAPAAHANVMAAGVAAIAAGAMLL